MTVARDDGGARAALAAAGGGLPAAPDTRSVRPATVDVCELRARAPLARSEGLSPPERAPPCQKRRLCFCTVLHLFCSLSSQVLDHE